MDRQAKNVFHLIALSFSDLILFQLNADMMTLNRTAIAASVASAFSAPALGAAVSFAVAACPEPVDYNITDFITCLRRACMNSVSASPLMKMAAESVKAMAVAPPTEAPAAA